MSVAGANGAKQNRILIAALAAVLLIFLSHVALGGTSGLTLSTVWAELMRGPGGSGENLIVWQLRLPRALGCLTIGASLGLVGSAFQALFRNPLADPFVVGVSSGASLGGIVAMITGLSATFGVLAFPICGFLGGLLSLLIVFSLTQRDPHFQVTHLLLAGSVTGSLLAALQSMALLLGGQDTNRVLQWLLGNMTVLQWTHFSVLLPSTVIGGILLLKEARSLNAFAISEQTATRVGINVGRLRNMILVVGTAMVACGIGVVGIIGFMGLAAPHIARRLVGVDWRYSMIGSGLVGMALLLVADMICQRSGDLLPVSVVTAVLGAPSLLILLRRPM